MSWSNIDVKKESGVGFLTIDRPKALNALDKDTLLEIEKGLDQFANDEEVCVVIITGAGDKAFIAGADISFMQGLTPVEGRKFARLGQKVLSKIENLEKPVIAAVNGFALGGGCELAMACDIRIASQTAKFGQPEVNLGLIAGFGGTQRLTRLVGPGRAKEMLFTADQIDADTAYKIGLVNHVVSQEELINYSKNVASKIAARGPVAVQLSKEAVNDGLEMDLEKALIHEANLFAVAFSTEDKEEGISAFLAKKKPEFKGR